MQPENAISEKNCQPDSRRSHRELWAVLLLLALTVLAFMPSLRFPFLESWDDAELVAVLPQLQFNPANLWHWCRTPLIGVYMPLTMFSYMIDHALSGSHPFGYRLQSLCWHLLAVFMVFRCFRAAGLRLGLAWLAAAAFAIHPQRVESVAWISERKDVLCAALYFWSLRLYLIADGEKRLIRRSWLLAILAMLAKPMAISLPFVFMLVDVHRSRSWELRSALRRFRVLLVAAAAVAVAAGYFQHAERPLTAEWSRLIPTVIYNVGWYTANTLFPYELNPFYARIVFNLAAAAGMLVFALAFAAALGIAGKRLSRESRLCDLYPIAAAYGASLLPVIGFVGLGNIDHADRYNYIPSAFLLFLLASGLQRLTLPSRLLRQTVTATLSLWLLLLFLSTWDYLPAWRSYDRLLKWSIRNPHPNQFVMVELAMAERWRGNFALVEQLARRLDAAATGTDRLYPGSGHFYAEFLRAENDYAHNRFAAAEQRLLTIYPSQTPPQLYSSSIELTIHQRLIGGRLNRSHYRHAVAYIDRLLQWYQRRPRDFFYYYYLGLQAAIRHDWPLAEQSLQTAARLGAATGTSAAELQKMLLRCRNIDLSRCQQ